MKVTLTKLQAEEVEHKISILRDEPDLQAEYGLTAAQCETLLNDIPMNGGEWVIPDGAEEAVVGEMENHVVVLRNIADDARKDGEIGQARQVSRLATSLEKIFSVEESAMKENIDKAVDQLVEGQGHTREEIVGKLKDVFKYFSRNLGWGDRLTGLVRALCFLLIGEGKERKVNMTFVASHLPALIKYLEDNKQEGYLEVVNSALSYLKDEGALGEGVNEAIEGSMMLKVGLALRDTKTGISYTISQVVKPIGGKVAWVEITDRRGNTIKIAPEAVGDRYLIKEDGSSGPYRYSLRHPKSTHPTRRFRASIYVDVWVPETDDLEADREVAKQQVEEYSAAIKNSYVGDVAHYTPHVTSGSPLDREL